MPIGSWIYEVNTPTGGGTPPPFVPPDAPPVSIDSGAARDRYDGTIEIQIAWTASVAANPDNFRGVAIFLEDPDISATSGMPMDGTAPMDNTGNLSGKWVPIKQNDSFESPATFLLPAKAYERSIRVYAQAFGKVTNATLVRANKPAPTPSVVIDIPADAGEYVDGQEYAWVVTDPSVTQVDDWDRAGGPVYHLVFDFTEPDPAIPLPPGLRPFGGVQIVYEYSDGTRNTHGPFLESKKPEAWVSPDYPAGGGGAYTVYFVSVDVDGRVNSIAKDWTPSVDITVVYPPAGQASAPYITGLAISNTRQEWQPDFSILSKADLSWIKPTSPRFGGVYFYRTGVTPPRLLGEATGNVSSLTLSVLDWPPVAEAWTVVAISVDYNGQPSDDPAHPGANTPRVTWNIGPAIPAVPPVGISGVVIADEQQVNSDGIQMMRFKLSGWTLPTDNSFGGTTVARVYNNDISTAVYWDVPKNQTFLNTDWEGAQTTRDFDFYFLSRDGQGKRDTLQIGISPHKTYHFVPVPGKLLTSRMPTDWFNTSEFDWPTGGAGLFTAKQFIAEKIYVGSILRVGGGVAPNPAAPAGQFQGLQNGQIAVYNASNVLRGWVGQQDGVATANQPAHSVFGGWFSELYVGGDGPPTAPLYAMQDGTVIVGGFDVAGGRYPYISVRNASNTEVGRIGARIGLNSGVPSNDPAYNLQGAWFREFACGGISMKDWRMIGYLDLSSKAVFQLRNVDRFTIDYAAASGTNPNGAVRLEFGAGSFVAGGGAAGAWRFPGISMRKLVNGNPTAQGAAYIDRGLVCNGPSGAQMAALVIFNGDSAGGDVGPFWGQLTLGSPTSQNTNVWISGGDVTGAAHNGAAWMRLADENGNENFSVSPTGDLWVWGTIGHSRTAAVYINSSGTFVSSGGINTSGTIFSSSNIGSGGTISASNALSGQSLIIGGFTCAVSNAIWTGAGVQCASQGSQIFGGVFGVSQLSVGWPQTSASGSPVPPGGYGPGAGNGTVSTFLTGDGRTVYVSGGLILNVK